MLGWHITIYRQTDDGTLPATAESPEGIRLAVWQTGTNGLDWLDQLVKEGKAIDLGGNGYPCRYTTTVENLIPRIIKEPPEANRIWASSVHDILTEEWVGQTVIDNNAVAACRSGEWLLIEAWDES